jgi:hypothetical protein
MAYSSILKPDEYFNTVLYTGNSGLQTITGVGFQPDLVWFKSRSGAYDHALLDAVRAGSPPVYLSSNTTAAEGITGGGESMTYNSDGFAFNGNPTRINFSGETYVAWNWLGANTTVSNTAGTITSTVSANTTSGFSIVSYTGNGSASATIGHGLGTSNVGMIITKNRDQTDGWIVYHKSLGANNFLVLQTTDPSDGSVNKYLSVPTPTTYEIGNSGDMNTNTEAYIAYCFAEKKGFSKFGKYTGNGSADGTFAYTGFKPAFVILKRTDSSGFQWVLSDGVRDPYNAVEKYVHPSTSDPEQSGSRDIDFLSNGIKIRNSNTTWNASGGTYIYMAFAEQPFVANSGNGIPATAR